MRLPEIDYLEAVISKKPNSVMSDRMIAKTEQRIAILKSNPFVHRARILAVLMQSVVPSINRAPYLETQHTGLLTTDRDLFIKLEKEYEEKAQQIDNLVLDFVAQLLALDRFNLDRKHLLACLVGECANGAAHLLLPGFQRVYIRNITSPLLSQDLQHLPYKEIIQADGPANATTPAWYTEVDRQKYERGRLEWLCGKAPQKTFLFGMLRNLNLMDDDELDILVNMEFGKLAKEPNRFKYPKCPCCQKDWYPAHELQCCSNRRLQTILHKRLQDILYQHLAAAKVLELTKCQSKHVVPSQNGKAEKDAPVIWDDLNFIGQSGRRILVDVSYTSQESLMEQRFKKK